MSIFTKTDADDALAKLNKTAQTYQQAQQAPAGKKPAPVAQKSAADPNACPSCGVIKGIDGADSASPVAGAGEMLA